jgi:hypothetical protein
MASSKDHAEAERLGKKRAQMWPLIGVIFLTQQATFFSTPEQADLLRTVDHVKISAWLVLTLVLIAALWTGGFWFKRREVRALLDDDVTRANRGRALSLGFLLAMLTCVALYVFAMIEPVGIKLALHLILSVGIMVALIRFGMLERRAYRDG